MNDRGDLTILTAISNTREFLAQCKDAGYKRIAIRVATKHIPESVSFCFGPGGSVFAWPECPKDGWPAIWRIAQSFGCSSCGNGHQYQINNLPLIDGYYHLEKGKWVRSDK